MEKKVAQLTVELEAAKERDRIRDEQFHGLHAQIRAPLSTRAFLLPQSRESSLEARPPRDRFAREEDECSSRSGRLK